VTFRRGIGVPLSPALSFIIPAYNAVLTLPHTLTSLKAQTRTDWQAIVVDDGSEDTTQEMVRTAMAGDPRICLRPIAHGGVCNARNFGLMQAQAEWVCFLDADDWLRRDFCRRMLRAVRPDLDLIYCGHHRVAPDGEVIQLFSYDFERRGFECAARECPVAIHSVIVRRSLVEGLQGFDPALGTCEDWDLWQRVTRAGARIAAVPEMMAMYRMRNTSLSRQYHQVVADGCKVIKRGFSHDSRVPQPPEATADGARGDDEALRCSHFTAWCAAAEAASGGNGAALIEAYPCDFAGRTTELGKCLALALAIGAKTSFAGLAKLLPQLKSRYLQLLEALGKGQHQAGVSRGIAYAIEREILNQLPPGKSAQLIHVAKSAVDLKAISPIEPSRGVDVLVLEFLSHGRLMGRMETPIFAPCSRREIAELAFEFFGRRKFVKLCGLIGRPEYYLALAVFFARAGCVAGAHFVRSGFKRQTGLRTMLREMLNQTALRIAAHGEPALPNGHIAANKPVFPVEQKSVAPRTETAADYWNCFFSDPDPWNYGCDYEQTKYRRTLDILPPDSLDRVLELGCAEGMFTQKLAHHAKALIAADISSRALDRARARCADCGNVHFQLLDLVTDDIPGGQSLIICSEVLYYVGRDRLAKIATKLRDALAPGGRLVMANAFVLKDDMSATGFDWDQSYGSKVIHETFLAAPGLALERSVLTDLYRIDCFRQHEGQPASAPSICRMELDCTLDPELTRQIVWGGAWARRSELMAHEHNWYLPVLAYHRVAEDGPPPLRQWRVHPDLFRQQLRLLRAHGYHGITSHDLLKAIESQTPLSGRPVLITFDDGYQDFADTAWPILEAEGFTAEVFLVTGLVGKSASWDAAAGEAAALMDWPTIRTLHDKGVKFGSHLASHTPATNLSSQDLLDEAMRSRAELEAHLNSPILSIAAPYGATDERYKRILRSTGYRIGFAGAAKRADIRDDPYAMRRLEIGGSWNLDQFAQAMEISSTTPSEPHTQPLITVVIPAYNAARTIDETLRSARSQTHRNLEILVVDDGSQDDTAAIVLSHAAMDGRVRLITQANAGVAAARNRGIAEARSELIAPLDADDLWAPTKIEKQLGAMMRGGERTALVYTWFAMIDEHGNVYDLDHQPQDSGRVLRRMCRRNLVGNGSSPLMRKQAVLEAGGFEPGLRAQHGQGCEDLLLYFRIAERHEFAVVPEHLTGYRRHRENMSENSLQMLRSHHLVTEEMHRKYPEYAGEIHAGEIDLVAWLIRRALRQFRIVSALNIFIHIAPSDMKFILAVFTPSLFLRAWRKWRDAPMVRQKPQLLSFHIGSPNKVGS
jgi:glycosyltransferase involved in cell wall biosynthesis/peptidoglycan/xylan/chitin deacetylase (PgdA/CDA1 family)